MKANKVYYKAIDKRSYTTNRNGLEFEISINGISARGVWSNVGQYPMDNGMDCNEIKVGQYSKIKIFDGGGSCRSYELHGYLEELEKQPKDLRWTGPYLNVAGLKREFVTKVQNAIDGKSKVNLTKEFIEFFNIQITK